MTSEVQTSSQRLFIFSWPNREKGVPGRLITGRVNHLSRWVLISFFFFLRARTLSANCTVRLVEEPKRRKIVAECVTACVISPPLLTIFFLTKAFSCLSVPRLKFIGPHPRHIHISLLHVMRKKFGVKAGVWKVQSVIWLFKSSVNMIPSFMARSFSAIKIPKPKHILLNGGGDPYSFVPTLCLFVKRAAWWTWRPRSVFNSCVLLAALKSDNLPLFFFSNSRSFSCLTKRTVRSLACSVFNRESWIFFRKQYHVSCANFSSSFSLLFFQKNRWI